MDFTINTPHGLARIAQLTGRHDEADVVRDALAFYEHMLKKRLSGQRLFVGNSRKELTEMAITTFEVAALKAQDE